MPPRFGDVPRYSEYGLARLADELRPGRPVVIDEVDVLAETLADKGKPPACAVAKLAAVAVRASLNSGEEHGQGVAEEGPVGVGKTFLAKH